MILFSISRFTNLLLLEFIDFIDFTMELSNPLVYGPLVSISSTIAALGGVYFFFRSASSGGGPVGASVNIVTGYIKIFASEIVCTSGLVLATYKYCSPYGLGVALVCKLLQYVVLFSI